MTKKDYIATADAIKNLKGVPKRYRKQMANSMIVVFQNDNVRFDSRRFLDACGL